MLLLLTLLGALSAPPDGYWIDVPFVHQDDDNGCGAASAQMILAYWSSQGLYDEEPGYAREALQPESNLGVRGSSLQSFFEGIGFSALIYKGTWTDLQQQIRKGRPLIVSIDGGGSTVPLHYVVVCGFDSASGLVYVNDPARRKLLGLRRSQFEERWSQSGNWTLLTLPGRSE